MIKNKSALILALAALALAMLACTFNQISAPKATPRPNSNSATQPAGDQPQSPGLFPFASTQTPAPTATSMPSNPIGLRQGLSSLNSYRLTIQEVNNGPTALDQNQMTFKVEMGSDGNSWHVSNSTVSSSKDSPTPQTNTSDQYKVGTIQCQSSSGSDKAEKSTIDPMAQEITDAWSGLLDMVPMVHDPVFIGTEQINGINTHHFKFKVSGLGTKSGAQVLASDGEYWLAVDGQYIVRYSVKLETRSGPAGDPNTKDMRSEFKIDATDINQPITITIPSDCH